MFMIDCYRMVRARHAPRPITDFAAGMDELLAKHFAHLFIRDPLVIFSESIDQDDETMSDHFEVRALCTRASRD